MNSKSLVFGDVEIGLGERRHVEIGVSESYSGLPISVPLTVWRAEEAGPTVFVTAAVHGDELNGAGIVRSLLIDPSFELLRGSLILAPVVNVLGLERHQRYLPDRRDLNRSFPGAWDGSLARRFARAIFEGIVKQSDYGIDLHTAAVRRTNYPNVRADLGDPAVKRLAFAFKSEIVISGKGPMGSLRRTASARGCPTIILEAGEVWKIEPSVVEAGIRGVRNVLIWLGMVEGEAIEPPYQLRVDKTKWVRAESGGFLEFHVAPGALVVAGQEIATNADWHGEGSRVICAPADGVVIGMTTLPVVSPGDPVFHLAIPRYGMKRMEKALEGVSEESLHARLKDDLSSSFVVTEWDDD